MVFDFPSEVWNPLASAFGSAVFFACVTIIILKWLKYIYRNVYVLCFPVAGDQYTNELIIYEPVEAFNTYRLALERAIDSGRTDYKIKTLIIYRDPLSVPIVHKEPGD